MPTPPYAKSRVATLEPAKPAATPVSPQSAQARAQRDMIRLVRATVMELIRGVSKEDAAPLALEFRDGAAHGGFGVSCKGRLLLVYPEKDGVTVRFRASAGQGQLLLDRHMTATAIMKTAMVEQAARALVRDFIAEVAGKY